MEELQPVQKSLQRYKIITQINEGSYGRVELARDIFTDELVCLKRMDLKCISNKERNGCLQEIRLLQMLPAHSNIIGYRDSFINANNKHELILVLEYADEGDLSNLTNSSPHPLPENQILITFSQIVQAVAYLHSWGILHRDLKTQNIFLIKRKDSIHALIGDLGSAALSQQNIGSGILNTNGSIVENFASTFVGTPLTLSPEVCDGKSYGFPADIWALGCILYELLTLKSPFIAPTYPATILKITSGIYEALPLSISHGTRALVDGMLQLDPVSRPTAKILQDQVQAVLQNLVGNFSSSIPNASVDGSTLVYLPTSGEIIPHLPPPPPITKPGIIPPTSKYDRNTENKNYYKRQLPYKPGPWILDNSTTENKHYYSHTKANALSAVPLSKRRAQKKPSSTNELNFIVNGQNFNSI